VNDIGEESSFPMAHLYTLRARSPDGDLVSSIPTCLLTLASKFFSASSRNHMLVVLELCLFAYLVKNSVVKTICGALPICDC
jgi:hypothetical protein